MWGHVDNGGLEQSPNPEFANDNDHLQSTGDGKEKCQRLAKRPLVLSRSNRVCINRLFRGDNKKRHQDRSSKEDTKFLSGGGRDGRRGVRSWDNIRSCFV